MASAFRVVLITAPRGKKARGLAAGLVDARLAACVNVVPGVVSHYRWKGKRMRDAECLLVAKTSASRLAALKAWIGEHHTYDNPEVLALKVEDGAKAYLAWLARELA